MEYESRLREYARHIEQKLEIQIRADFLARGGSENVVRPLFEKKFLWKIL